MGDSIDEQYERARKQKELQRQQQQQQQQDTDGPALGTAASSYYGDQDLYGASSSGEYSNVVQELDEEPPSSYGGARRTWSAAKEILAEVPVAGDHDPDAELLPRRKGVIAERESDYHARRRTNRMLSPDRVDAFQAAEKGDVSASSGGAGSSSYAQVMRETLLDKERHEVQRKLEKQQQEERELQQQQPASSAAAKKRSRWDQSAEPIAASSAQPTPVVAASQWEQPDPQQKPSSRSSRWDQTPVHPSSSATAGEAPARKRSRWDETPVVPSAGGAGPAASAWEQTPKVASGLGGETPLRSRSRWDETPVTSAGAPASGATPSVAGSTPFANPSMYTPLIGMTGASASTVAAAAGATDSNIQFRFDNTLDARNRPMTDEELDAILPSEGYKILEPPASYKPIHTPARKLMATPAPMSAAPDGFYIQQDGAAADGAAAMADMVQEIPAGAAGEDMPHFKPEDIQFFGKLLDKKEEQELSLEEVKERKIMRLLLKIKNGMPIQRKASLKEIAEKARIFGAGPLFNQILPLLMSPTLEEQERHLLVKVIDRILYKLDDLVRPYVHKILVVIEPLLIDEDYYARVEGREIISNLSKAAGLATMISTMRPDIDHVDEYVRNTTARAFSVVASALGIPALLPFLKAVCKSKKSWQARHTGTKIIQQIAVLMGCAVLPHLGSMVETIAFGLEDEQQKVRTMTALAVSALAEAAAPYGIESFDVVLKPLWKGIRKHRGKSLAAFLKAIGYIIPLMDAEYANHYTREVMTILIREFQTPDEEMKKIVLKVVKQCSDTDGVEAAYIKQEILPEFFRSFWIRRMALDKRNYKQLVETTVALAQKVGVSIMLERLAADLKDEAEPYRKMVVEAIDNIIGSLGAADVDERLEVILIDGMLYAFQEQIQEDMVILRGFGTLVNALGLRTKPYLSQICSTILWRLNNKAARVRQQAADLIAKIALVMNTCGEEKLLAHLGGVLYEYLGEEYPEVLGSILNAIKAIVNVIGMTKMNPPIKDLLPRLTPIMKNRHEKVQENVIDLIGRIADRGAEFVSAREWMRICFELLESLKAHKKAIRRAAVNTFGYIAKAIGPHDVLATLLNNLKVQERQMRVCTTVAIAIVAETCSPFTVIPALMNEYRFPEMYVQNGVLKSFSFMFEYIGEMGKDYVYAVLPLLEDALMDRDRVHRQTACTTVKHLALGCYGMGCEDSMAHLMNLVWPNIFETAAHMITAATEAAEGLRVGLGAASVLQYLVQGLFHPARKVREIYWKVFNTTYIGSQEQLVPYYPRLLPGETSVLDYVL